MTFLDCYRQARDDVLRVVSLVLLWCLPAIAYLVWKVPGETSNAFLMFTMIILTWNFSLTGPR